MEIKTNKEIHNPICELAKTIKFKNGMCPYSKCKNCKECIKDENDLLMIHFLHETKRFGIC